MGELIREFDWGSTPVGPISRWPQSLRTAISIVLESRFPMYIAWGPEYTQFYNDAFRPILGATKHPAALGISSTETFAEAWDEFVGPLFNRVLKLAEPTYLDDALVPLDRFGFLEECYFTFCYSAIRNEEGGVGGVLVTVVETTARVLGQRRLATLRDLAARDAKAGGPLLACQNAAEALGANPADLPFAGIYLLNEDGRTLQLVGCAGVEANSPATPLEIDLKSGGAGHPWPIAPVLQTREMALVDDVAARVGAMPGGPWPEPARRALVCPLALPGEERPYGVLVAGLGPRLALDDEYRGFVELVAGQIASGIASARAYDEDRRRAAALAEIDRAKTAFFSNVSHEFRTPLTLLLSPAEELLTDTTRPLAPEHRAQIEVVHRNGLRLLNLVNALLDFTRIEAGRSDASFEPTDLPVFTCELASTFRSAVERAGLALEVHCPPLPATLGPVYVDCGMWEKIVLNLLSNAFKHTFEGSIRVSLSAREHHAVLEVRDSGVGIPSDQLPHVFTRFHRVPHARARTHEGSGIGLALVQELVHLHGGTIEVSSEEQAGATFVVKIPTGKSHLPAEHVTDDAARARGASSTQSYVAEAERWIVDGGAHAAAAVRTEDASRPETATGNVLLADDNADMRDYVTRLLRDAGWHVRAVADGRRALEEAVATPPDLVLADIMMPGLDGFELLRALRERENTKSLPIILLSARAGEEARVEGLAAGADDYMVKPFSARELLARVSAHVALAKLRARATMEIQAAHRQLSAVLEQAPVAVTVLRGPRHVYELTNPFYRLITGNRPLLGRAVADVFPEVEAQGLIATLDEVYRTGVPFVGRGVPMAYDRKGDGVMVPGYFNFTSTPMTSESEIVGIITIATEITDEVNMRRAAEEARRDADTARKEAEEANRAKSEFLAAMSHELRTPLNAIGGYVQLLELGVHGALNPAQRKALSRVKRSEQHLLALITDVLNFAKLEAGRVEYDIQDVNVEAVVADAAPIIESQLAAKQIAYEVHIPAQLTVRGDADKLRQILLNLLSNAAKFTSAGGRVTVDASAREEGPDGGRPGMVFLRVTDTGMGIARDKQDSIFDPFIQVHRHLTHSAEGTGLGLSISRDLARAMDGELRVRSVEGEGSTFTLTLPRGSGEPSRKGDGTE
ncbi:MAG: ATP-binding protein [Gemmatimonadaceae bacterium]